MERSFDNIERFGAERRDEGRLFRTRPARPREDEPQSDDAAADLKRRIHNRLLEEKEPGDLARASRSQLQSVIEDAFDQEAAPAGRPMPDRLRTRIAAELLDELVGYGPIQTLLDDPTITEIMVNGPRQVFIERSGKIHPSDRVFSDDAHVMRVIERMISPVGRRIDESSPMVDARLADGSRVNVIIPPLSLRGPVVTVRKFARQALGIEGLVRLGTLTEEMRRFLQGCVAARLNVLISGGTGSGKTTTLNALSAFIPDDERIVTIEDAAELQLQQAHVIPLESKPPNVEGQGEITIRQLVRNALRMRPDRIIVGEVRGGEAIDMLQAMNTGHDGSLSTLHSNTPRDSIVRLEMMALLSGVELPARSLREQIAGALHLLVHQSRLQDGTRRITHVTEVHGIESDVVVLQDIFRWEQTALDAGGRVIGAHRATGLRPQCLSWLAAHGIELPPHVFMPPEGGPRR